MFLLAPLGKAVRVKVGTPKQELALSLGNAIRTRRLELGLTQEQVAERADGIDANYFGRIERGEKNVSVALLVSVARALETSASELLEGVV